MSHPPIVRLIVRARGEALRVRPVEGQRYPMINAMPASWPDCELIAVDEAGGEHPIMNCTGITWRCKQGTEAASAVIDFVDVDLDVELDGNFSAFSVDVHGKARLDDEGDPVLEGNVAEAPTGVRRIPS